MAKATTKTKAKPTSKDAEKVKKAADNAERKKAAEAQKKNRAVAAQKAITAARKARLQKRLDILQKGRDKCLSSPLSAHGPMPTDALAAGFHARRAGWGPNTYIFLGDQGGRAGLKPALMLAGGRSGMLPYTKGLKDDADLIAQDWVVVDPEAVQK